MPTLLSRLRNTCPQAMLHGLTNISVLECTHQKIVYNMDRLLSRVGIYIGVVHVYDARLHSFAAQPR